MSTGDSSSFNFRNLFHLLSAGSFLIQIFLTVFCLVTSHIHFTYSAPKVCCLVKFSKSTGQFARSRILFKGFVYCVAFFCYVLPAAFSSQLAVLDRTDASWTTVKVKGGCDSYPRKPSTSMAILYESSVPTLGQLSLSKRWLQLSYSSITSLKVGKWVKYSAI